MSASEELIHIIECEVETTCREHRHIVDVLLPRDIPRNRERHIDAIISTLEEL